MKIKHFLYNTFLIENDKIKIAIDPGQSLYLFRPRSLIPESEWSTVTHILVTHGDPDHEWHVDRVAAASGAPVVCGRELVKEVDSETLLLSPRRRGVIYDTRIENIHPLDVGETIDFGDLQVKGIKSVHGPLESRLLGLIKVRVRPGPGERIGLGAMGFEIRLRDAVIVNLPVLFTRRYAPADERMFKEGVERLGIECRILKYGDEWTYRSHPL